MECCSKPNEDMPACYELPNMKEVRANLLWDNNQHERLQALRHNIHNAGKLLNYYPPFGWKVSD